jgi:hypothetical protein
MTDAHFTHSTLRERIVEHVFVGDALRALWRRGIHDVEVLRPEFDAHGYDLVVARGRTVRHVQFKAGQARRPKKVSLARALAEKPSGCAIWISVSPALDMGPFFWLGGSPGEPLPSLAEHSASRRPTPNKNGERPVRQNHVDVPARAFSKLDTLDDVLVALFGVLEP